MRAIDPERFMPIEEFRARIDRLVDHVKASEVASGVEEVFIAGEPVARRKAERLRDGIPVSAVAKYLAGPASTLVRRSGPRGLWRGRGRRRRPRRGGLQ